MTIVLICVCTIEMLIQYYNYMYNKCGTILTHAIVINHNIFTWIIHSLISAIDHPLKQHVYDVQLFTV